MGCFYYIVTVKAMFVVLDTNHFTEFANATAPGKRLMARIRHRQAEAFSCIVAAEESLRGWLAFVRNRANGLDQLEPYTRLLDCIGTLNQFTILPFDREAAVTFHRLQKELPRTGTMDLKIAAICLAHDATLLSRNLVDFQDIPGLRVENWLD
jgi:tRNA(fMet)-specific endonuclease VapC